MVMNKKVNDRHKGSVESRTGGDEVLAKSGLSGRGRSVTKVRQHKRMYSVPK